MDTEIPALQGRKSLDDENRNKLKRLLIKSVKQLV